ncbi:hypothetical protein SELMODRAFT_432320 [Selaginella moellendorffii]|uniref:Uncharacterized protein n=1 Tax=Selaginella moellendorffii TaxID=88036 RepID=D8TFM7_SELML|nr:hypothetical protein SELMODRAFT_432320 [Selaginella moellendorffii]
MARMDLVRAAVHVSRADLPHDVAAEDLEQAQALMPLRECLRSAGLQRLFACSQNRGGIPKFFDLIAISSTGSEITLSLYLPEPRQGCLAPLTVAEALLTLYFRCIKTVDIVLHVVRTSLLHMRPEDFVSAGAPENSKPCKVIQKLTFPYIHRLQQACYIHLVVGSP